MPRKRRNLKYTKERVVLSEVLPYELPATYSNRYFYEFLNENKIQFNGAQIEWAKKSDCLDNIIKVLFGLDSQASPETVVNKISGKEIQLNAININNTKYQPRTIPFVFKITHKKNEYRELAICHPRNQIQIVEFYNVYKELILYYSSVSDFSIRHPKKISKVIFQKDNLHKTSLSNGQEVIEEFGKEYENLRSFFVYDKYSNIYKFYESYLFHRCEKKYEKLLKLDLSKCFDSIYTHSLSWAVLSKEVTKENITQKDSFADNFDKLMRQLNYNETNGIIIGPEFSRIFAELILQSIDHRLRKIVENKHKKFHKTDYEIFRYVDDYFLFYQDEYTKEFIVAELQVLLKEFKLSLNPAKSVVLEKPIITNISIAKARISDLFNENLGYTFESSEEISNDGSAIDAKTVVKAGKIKVDSRSLITKYKTIIRECNVEYSDMMNYSLSIIERKSRSIIRDYFEIDHDINSEKNVVNALLGVVEFSFFIFSVSPRVNFTIKICSILQNCIIFLKRDGGNRDFKHLIFKAIFDDIRIILNKNQQSDFVQLETLYLLITLGELGKDYWLEFDALKSFFGIDEEEETGKLIAKWELNYLSLSVLLFYMKNKVRYAPLRQLVELEIRKKFDERKSLSDKDTELVLLFFDTLTCPYISEALKRDLLSLYGITDGNAQNDVISFRPFWFTKWTDLDFRKELDAKRSQEVY